MKAARLFLAFALVLSALTGLALAEEKIITMSTTTSTQASGLLDVLLPELEKDTGIKVKVVAKGTGAAIRDGADGNVDVIFVHDTAREEKFVADGFGTKRYAVMHNDFVLVGPADDPAKVKGVPSIEAFKKIAAVKAFFISRGDDSGTHAKEQEIWKATGLALKKTPHPIKKEDGTMGEISAMEPEGDWYLSVGQGMGKTLTMTDEKKGYTLTDRGTYVNIKFGGKAKLDSEILVEGDKALFNPYGVIPVSPKKFPHIKNDLAEQFAQWLVSKRGQSVIANYKVQGKVLFFPDAIPDAK